MSQFVIGAKDDKTALRHDELLNQALKLQRAARLDEARAICDHLLINTPDHGTALHLRGVIALQTGSSADAVEFIGRALALSPKNPELLHHRSLALRSLRRFREALTDLEAVVSLSPRFAQAYLERGNVLASLGQYIEAVDSLNQALRLEPELVPALVSRGYAFHRQELWEQALASFDQALTIQPNNSEALTGRGLAFKDSGRLVEAIATFETAVREQPDNVAAHKGLFWSLISALDRDEDVEVVLETLLTITAHVEKQPGHISFLLASHALEQTEHLLSRGGASPTVAESYRCLTAILTRFGRNAEGMDSIALSTSESANLARLKNPPLRYRSKTSGPCVNSMLDWREIEQRYFSALPQVAVIDDFLSVAALDELRSHCLRSTIWNTDYSGRYLGAFAEDGFMSPLHLQIARELRIHLPQVVGNHPLVDLWAFKYSAGTTTGIGVHADFARINLNFWITPDTANLNPESGGLLVYNIPAPKTWGFQDYNKDETLIREYMARGRAKSHRIPYRCNRAVLFDSSLFHETDEIQFSSGYENRRINVTYLFGRGLTQ